MPRRWSGGWVLTVVFLGIPLWWVLGVIEIAFLLMGVPLLLALMRRSRVEVPRGFGLWLLLLVWLLSGLLVLQVDAPGAEPGASMSRYTTFAYRYLWYLVGTVALLYVVNARRSLTTQQVSWAISWLFVALLGGGWLAIFLPTLEFRSALELVLPRAITGNEFVTSLIHPRVAQQQDFLGYVQPRPSAPFFYANQWGINLAVTLPHFVVSWWTRGGRWRVAMPLVLLAAAAPVITSLNRTLWAAVVAMVLYAVLHLARHGRVRIVVVLGVVLAVAATALALSPLGQLVVERFANPHSDEGRANLGLLALQSTWEGSPVVGFGTTRDVAGNFTSIAGGATEACPRCSPPPLGTQGQLWLLAFGSGFVALGLYVAFFAGALLRHFRDPSPHSLAAQASLVSIFVTMPFYAAVHSAIVVALLSVAVLHREAVAVRAGTLADLVAPARRSWGVVVVTALVGCLVAVGATAAAGTPVSASRSLVVSGELRLGGLTERPLTMDGEARLVTSAAVLETVARATGEEDLERVRDAVSISARPNSRILHLTYTAADAATARAGADTLAAAYITVRQELVVQTERSRRESWQQHQLGLASSLSVLDRPGLTLPPRMLDRSAAEVRALSRDLVATAARQDEAEGVRVVRSRDDITSSDPWVVALASGLAAGAALGLVLARAVDGRFVRLGRRPDRCLGPDLPVVARIPDPGSGRPGDGGDPAQVTAAYAPLAGVVGDPGSSAALALAARLDRAVVGDRGVRTTSPRRVVVVVDDRSRPRDVRRLHRWCVSSGLEPVGLVLLDRGPSRGAHRRRLRPGSGSRP